MRIAVAGSSGFIGTELTKQLEGIGHEIIRLHTPRLGSISTSDLSATAASTRIDHSLVEKVRGCNVLINAAGNPDASENDESTLNGPNALLVAYLGRLCQLANIPRFIHVSSAVVQGSKKVLDSSMTLEKFSPYAKSKISGESFAQQYGPLETIIYRPPSVHHETRRVTQQLYRLANSPLSSVASPGDSPTPQVLLESVGQALVLLATSANPPSVVHHPWEGITTSALLRHLGNGKHPILLPKAVTHLTLWLGKSAALLIPVLRPYIRRVELVWHGQQQGPSWLDLERPDPNEWRDLATRVAKHVRKED